MPKCGVLLADGNWNNGDNAGVTYRNSNNDASNTNHDIGTHVELRSLSSPEQRFNLTVRSNTRHRDQDVSNVSESFLQSQGGSGIEMKRLNNLLEQIIDPENIALAHHNAKRGKSDYAEVQMVEKDKEYFLGKIYKMLKERTFTTAPYKNRTIFDSGKIRAISKLPYYPDRIVQHAIMNIIQPVWDKVFIYDCYAAIPGKGIHLGLKRLRGFLRDKENTQYCLKFDIRKYYPSVSHAILMSLIERKIKCKDTLCLLENVIRSPGGEKGIPIGNYLSQYFANIYLNWFDHWLKEEKNVSYYIRYCDDGVILDGSKERLNLLLAEITDYFHSLKLDLNPKTQIFPVDKRGIDFLGYRSFRTYTLLRKYSVKRLKSRIRLIKKQSNNLAPQAILSSIMSYTGWIKHCNGYNLLTKLVLENEPVRQAMEQASVNLAMRNPLRRLANG